MGYLGLAFHNIVSAVSLEAGNLLIGKGGVA